MKEKTKSCLFSLLGWGVIFILMVIGMYFVDKMTESDEHIEALNISMDNDINYFVHTLTDSLDFVLDSTISTPGDRFYATLHGPIIQVDGCSIKQDVSISASPVSNKVFLVCYYLTPMKQIKMKELVSIFFYCNENIKTSFGHFPQAATYFDYENRRMIDNPDKYDAMWFHVNGMIWEELHEENQVISVIYSDNVNRKLYCKENGLKYEEISPYDLMSIFE